MVTITTIGLIVGIIIAVVGGLIKTGIVHLTDNIEKNNKTGWVLIIIGIIIAAITAFFLLI